MFESISKRGNMRTIEDMQRRAQDVIQKGADRDPLTQKPSVLEMQLAHDNIQLIKIFEYSKKFVAAGFYDDWVKGLENFGVK